MGKGAECFASTVPTAKYRRPCTWLVTVIIWPVSVNHFQNLIDDIPVWKCPSRSLFLLNTRLISRLNWIYNSLAFVTARGSGLTSSGSFIWPCSSGDSSTDTWSLISKGGACSTGELGLQSLLCAASPVSCLNPKRTQKIETKSLILGFCFRIFHFLDETCFFLQGFYVFL